MTASESKEEFNLRYNNALEGAPGLDTFEISSYLTVAQEQLVKNYYDVSRDPSSAFELHEKARRVLNELVTDEKISSQVASTRGLVSESKFYELANEAMYILVETVTISSGTPALNGKIIPVLPVTHDEFMISNSNPFRKPNKNKAWRLDVSKENSKTTVEIVSDQVMTRYNVRYLSYPSPIIVEDLTTAVDVAGMGLTINGKTAQATCLLSELAHREIINIAVQNAVADYRDGSLQARMKLDSRV
ncbi:MAG: hypothetical protein KUG81_07545 [Gammaproteobacteria bacterium]|nr:hypothetical protein [Gammaproteobacteria bacterium]